MTALQGDPLTLVASRREHLRPLLQYSIPAIRPETEKIPGNLPAGQGSDCYAATSPAPGGPAPASTGLIIAALIDGLHKLASPAEISGFLAQVERRAFKHAMFAVRDEDAALDIVQDAMLKLTERYAAKPVAELPMLFQRILQNTIHDHFRRQKVRSAWTTLLSAFGNKEEKDEDYDPLETLQAKSDSNATSDPAGIAEQAQTVAVIEQALSRLPARQREAFLLRYWEELDVAETAAAMGCSEGSVKTHCSRAVHALAEMLKARGVTP